MQRANGKKVYVGMTPVGKQRLPAGHVGDLRKKVFVGMSGGVDSSVSAALLKRAGFEVTGVFIKVWQPPFIACASREDRLDAMRVAALIDIPFVTLDLEKEYKEGVVDYMLREYARGATPNPDAMCNKEVKFGAFLAYATKQGADYVATGHYARNVFNAKSGRFELHQSTDKEKDQSYFLWNLGQQELARTLFPVGGMQKGEVRRLAKEFGLPTAEKKDSQGLCFIGKIDMKEFLAHYIRPKKGKVRDMDGNIVGWHQGAALYTIGERHGFEITKKGSDERRRYVVGKNMKKNELIVSGDPASHSASRTTISGRNANFTLGVPPEKKRYFGRFRYRGKLTPVVVTEANKRAFSIRPERDDYTVTTGQSIVLYDGTLCLGGGIIE